MAILSRTSKSTGKTSYQVLIDRRDPDTNTRKRVVVGTYRKLGAAKKAEREAMVERDRGTLVDPQKMTIGALLDTYLTTEVPKSVSLENRQGYQIVVDKHLKPALGHIKVQRLTAQHVDALYSTLIEREYSASLIRKVHQRLSAALRLAVRWQIVRRNVCEAVTLPKMTTKPPKVWTPQEAARFLATARDGGESLVMYVTLMAETGARTSELLGVSWKDVDFDRNTIRFGAQVVRLMGGTPIVKAGGKTESAVRTIRLTMPTMEALREHRKAWVAAKLSATEWADAHELIFVSKTGRPLNARNVRRAFDRMVKLAGVPEITPHGVRKSHITAAIAAGAPMKAVSSRVGHRDLATTLKIDTALTRGQEDSMLDIVSALMTAVPAGAADDEAM
jgi:integrase